MFLAIVIAFFSVIFLMIIHEFGHFIIAKKMGVKVEEFGIGYPPRLLGKKIGQTIYSINLIPLGAFVKIFGEEGGIEDYRSFSNLSIKKRALIVLGGVISFWAIAVILFVILFNIGVNIPISDEEIFKGQETKVKIVRIAPNSPAFFAGLKKGDAIVKIQNLKSKIQTPIEKMGNLQEIINKSRGEEIILTIERGKNVFDVSLVPRSSPPPGEGAIGVQLERTATIIPKIPWYKTPIEGVLFCGKITYRAIDGLVGILFDLLKGKRLPAGVEPAGPVGITVFLARAVDFGIGFFIYLVATIATLLAVFNLFPIPALDGGKLLFLAIEKIKSKPISPKVEQTITVAFFFLLIALSFFVTIKFDIPKLVEFIKTGF